MEDMEIVKCYQEAAYCLQQVADECQKSVSVNLNFILERCEQCAQLLDKLHILDDKTSRIAALQSLTKSLAYFRKVFYTKALQLESQDSQSQSSWEQIEDTQQSKNSAKRDDNDKSRQLAIEDTIIRKGNVTFEDVAGLEEAKQALKEAIIMPLQYPQLFSGALKPWRRILLYGPPGTGKSRLAQAVSSEIQSTFYCVSSSDLVSSYVGESEKHIKELFQHATSHEGQSVIFIDEIDSICRQRSSREEEHTRRIKTELLKQMEGADNSDKHDQIFLLCATNCPWEIDSAFIRRFQKRIYIPLPDKAARISLMKIHCKDKAKSLSADDWSTLGDKTEGYSGSDIANVVLEALFQPIRDMQSALFWKHISGNQLMPCASDDSGAFRAALQDLPPDQVQPHDATVDHFVKSLTSHRNTVTQDELDKFEQFTKYFGQNG